MTDWEAPGLAIAVVRNDSIIFAKGYGVREIGKPDPVTADTVFAIGSTSKAFTVGLLGMLVDEKRLTWDDRVTKYLPSFELFDSYATRDLTIRDLLTHRSGRPRGDRLWANSGYSRAEVLRRVRFLEPGWPFRSRYGYQNIMFLAAGTVAESAASKSWDDLVAERIFRPLGMSRSVTSVTLLPAMTDVATQFQRDRHGPVDSDAAGAGNLPRQCTPPRCTSGSAKRMRKTHPETHLLSYGLGWAIRDSGGMKVVSHGGAIRGNAGAGRASAGTETGVVVLTNVAESSLPTAMGYKLVDLYTAGPPKDWSGVLLASTKAAGDRAAEERRKVEAGRVMGPSRRSR